MSSSLYSNYLKQIRQILKNAKASSGKEYNDIYYYLLFDFTIDYCEKIFEQCIKELTEALKKRP